MDWQAGFSSCGECDMDRLRFISFYTPFLSHFCIASTLVCSFCEAMLRSLSVAKTAVSSANVAVVESVDFDRSKVFSRYNGGPRTMP
jgi:hypothetical protein